MSTGYASDYQRFAAYNHRRTRIYSSFSPSSIRLRSTTQGQTFTQKDDSLFNKFTLIVADIASEACFLLLAL